MAVCRITVIFAGQDFWDMRKGWLHGMIKVLLLTIFLGYVGILVFYSHIHVVGGVTIVHAHPFQQDDSAPFHTHSQAEFQLYHVLSSLNVGDDVVPHFIFGVLPNVVVAEVSVFVCEGYALMQPSDVSLRAPPVC